MEIRPRSVVAITSGSRSMRASLLGLNRLLDLAGLEAARTDVGTRGTAVQHDADALQVGVEAALRRDHGVAAAVTEAGLLPTDGANLAHERLRSVAVSEPRLRGDARTDRPSRARSARTRRPCPPAPRPA